MTAPPPNPTQMDISTSKTIHNSSHDTLPPATSKKPRDPNDMNTSNSNNDEQTNPSTITHKKNHENDSIMVDNPYGADNCERLLNHAVNITYERDIYTTPITLAFRQKSDQTSITPAKLHRELCVEMLIINPTTKLITNDGKVYTHPKELPIGTEYINTFTEATVNNKKFNTVKAYVCCKIETALHYKKFMYNDNGAKTILPFLRHNNMWLKWNKFSTHREV